ncbi:MAG: Sua5/YciO/YrdC/YwlC family protein [bacterium]
MMVNKIFAIKQRDEKKLFSIIAPDFDWIEKEYPEANIETLKIYLNTYHGVTYIFDYTTPGVRIIKHPFQNFVQALGEPFITTSCNISGEPAINDILQLPTEISEQVDYVIDG